WRAAMVEKVRNGWRGWKQRTRHPSPTLADPDMERLRCHWAVEPFARTGRMAPCGIVGDGCRVRWYFAQSNRQRCAAWFGCRIEGASHCRHVTCATQGQSRTRRDTDEEIEGAA